VVFFSLRDLTTSQKSDKPPVGYDDTPMPPNSKWRVHDGNRTQPRIVTPGSSPGESPSDAIVLFDGEGMPKWVGRDGGPVQWKVENGSCRYLSSVSALVNACRKPDEWQTCDIFFVAPRFEGEKLISPAYVTIVHNGILVHHHQEILGQTGHKILHSYRLHPPKGPIRLRDHGNPVRYRNIWMISIRRITGITLFLLGLLVSIVGYGLYRSPKLDWLEFKGTCRVLIEGAASEASRLVEDSTAIVGLITLITGLIMTLNGLKGLIFGSSEKKFSEIWNGKKWWG